MPKRIKTFDVALFIIPLIFAVTSVAVIYSLFLGTPKIELAYRQGIFAVIGLAAMIAAGFIDYRFLRGTSWIFYLISIVLLILVEIFGKTVNGAMNWVDLGFFQLQPSEVAKVFLVFSLSSFFSRKIGRITWRDIVFSLAILSLPLILILKEPDLGTALVVVFIYLVLFFASKPARFQLFIITTLIVALISLVLLSSFNVPPFSKLLKDYQRNRIIVFFLPENDPLGRGYNVRQAQISVGSGGVMGKGLGRGSQSQLQFLPEPHTDFVFAGIAESFGFLGTAMFLALYLYLISKFINIANMARDNFGMLISFGVAAMFIFQVLINIGMNLGLAPITGIPLPLLSSGGTSMIISLFAIGLVQSVFIRHKKISF